MSYVTLLFPHDNPSFTTAAPYTHPSLPLPPFTPFLPAPPAAHYSCLAPKIFTSTPIFANNLAISVKKNYLSHTHTWGRNSGPYIVTILSSIPPPGRHLLLPPLYPAAPHSPPSLPPAIATLALPTPGRHLLPFSPPLLIDE